jgi:hypothetical protein
MVSLLGSGDSTDSDGGSGDISLVNGSPAWSESYSDVRSSLSWLANVPWNVPSRGPPDRA